MGKRFRVDRASSALSRFSHLQVEHLAMNSERYRANNHVIGRDRRVVRVVAFLSVMRNAELILSSATVGVSGAQFQHFSSVSGHQAAHFLPGQVLINGLVPSALLNDQKAALHCNDLFGDVENLPAKYNRADTAAEAQRQLKRRVQEASVVDQSSEEGQPGEYGLCYLLRTCCERTVRAHHARSDFVADRQLVHDVVALWKEQQIYAIDAAIERKQEAAERPGSSETVRQRRAEEIVCLSHAADAMANPENRQTSRHIDLAIDEVQGVCSETGGGGMYPGLREIASEE